MRRLMALHVGVDVMTRSGPAMQHPMVTGWRHLGSPASRLAAKAMALVVVIGLLIVALGELVTPVDAAMAGAPDGLPATQNEPVSAGRRAGVSPTYAPNAPLTLPRGSPRRSSSWGLLPEP